MSEKRTTPVFSIRPFLESDADALVRILQENDQYHFPEVEGPAAMARVGRCSAAVFLVAEVDGTPVGLVRGVYDGARAQIHLLSVAKEHQGKGVGAALAQAAVEAFRSMGAPTFSVTAHEESAVFWEKMGFERLEIFLMLKKG